MPAIVVLILAAFFAAGNLLADAPDAPIQEQTKAQVIFASSAGEIRLPEVATGTRTDHLRWRHLDNFRHHPLPDSPRDLDNFRYHPLPNSPRDLWKPQYQERPPQILAEWSRERVLACLRGALPDANESELESALKDTANCARCPQVCQYLRNQRNRPFRAISPSWYPGLNVTLHRPLGGHLKEPGLGRRWIPIEPCAPSPPHKYCVQPSPSWFILTLTPNGGTNQ